MASFKNELIHFFFFVCLYILFFIFRNHVYSVSEVIFAINQTNTYLSSAYCVQINALGSGILRLKGLGSRLFYLMFYFFLYCAILVLSSSSQPIQTATALKARRNKFGKMLHLLN